MREASHSVGAAGKPAVPDDTARLLEIVDAGIAQGASDLHICPEEAPRIRVAGALRGLDTPAMSRRQLYAALRGLHAAHASAPGGEPLAEVPTDIELAVEHRGQRLRVTAFETLRGHALALRVVPNEPMSLADIPAPEAVTRLAELNQGLVAVTGPTGSGKSTTLAAMVAHINTRSDRHILTIEDPIEFVHTNQRGLISQRQIGRHAESFPAALRAALRADPDVIMVGEMRDAETIELVLTAAETGHLVLSTMHAASAAQAIDRMVDAFPSGEKELIRSMLANALAGVVAQRLLPRPGGGRAAALEVMTATTAVRNQIREGKIAQLPQTIELGRKAGMQTMAEGLRALLDNGLAEPDAVASALAQLDAWSSGKEERNARRARTGSAEHGDDRGF